MVATAMRIGVFDGPGVDECGETEARAVGIATNLR